MRVSAAGVLAVLVMLDWLTELDVELLLLLWHEETAEC